MRLVVSSSLTPKILSILSLAILGSSVGYEMTAPFQHSPKGVSPFRRARIELGRPLHPHQREVNTLPEILDFNAKHNLEHLFCLQTRKHKYEPRDETVEINFLKLKRLVEQCSVWLARNVKGIKRPHLDDGGRLVKAAPVALFLDSDIGLLTYLLSLLSIGVPVSANQ